MTTSTITVGRDAYVSAADTGASFGSTARIMLRSFSPGPARRGYLWIPPGDIAGRTVLSATLSGKAASAVPANTLTFQACDATKWTPSGVNWNNQPGTAGPTANAAIGPLKTGARFEVDVTNLMQQVANGAGRNGWRITTNSSTAFYLAAFNSGDAWQLEIVLSDAPVAPSQLVPDGGVIGREKPVVSFDYNDLSGTADLTAAQVQVDPAADDVAPEFDSGEVPITVPEVDLATTAYAGLADAATTQWRVRTKNTQGTWSEWSDWATMTRHVKPTLTVTNPSGGTVDDPTPVVAASASVGVVAQCDLSIAPVGNLVDVRYASGSLRPGTAAFTHEVPFKSKGIVVFPDSGDYRLSVRAWDRTDRQYDGDQPWLQEVVDFAIVGAGSGPDTLVASPTTDHSPGMRLIVTRLTIPEAFVVVRNNRRVARYSVGSDIPDTGPWTLEDPSVPPNTEAVWSVRAVTGGVESTINPSVTARSRVDGTWLLSRHGNVVIHGEEAVDVARVDRRQTFELPYRPDPVDIIGALGVFQGKVDGALVDDGDGVSVDAKRAIVEAIRTDPTRAVQLAWGQTSIAVMLRHVSVTPSPAMLPDYDNYQHRITFECWQTGELD